MEGGWTARHQVSISLERYRDDIFGLLNDIWLRERLNYAIRIVMYRTDTHSIPLCELQENIMEKAKTWLSERNNTIIISRATIKVCRFLSIHSDEVTYQWSRHRFPCRQATGLDPTNYSLLWGCWPTRIDRVSAPPYASTEYFILFSLNTNWRWFHSQKGRCWKGKLGHRVRPWGNPGCQGSSWGPKVITAPQLSIRSDR